MRTDKGGRYTHQPNSTTQTTSADDVIDVQDTVIGWVLMAVLMCPATHRCCRSRCSPHSCMSLQILVVSAKTQSILCLIKAAAPFLMGFFSSQFSISAARPSPLISVYFPHTVAAAYDIREALEGSATWRMEWRWRGGIPERWLRWWRRVRRGVGSGPATAP